MQGTVWRAEQLSLRQTTGKNARVASTYGTFSVAAF
jgi:hypothetical protein